MKFVLWKSMRQSLDRLKSESANAFQFSWNEQSGINGNAHPGRKLKQL
jgi:hypothetical protein